MKNIAISMIAAALFVLLGKLVVKADNMSSAEDWIANPKINKVLRPNRSTVNVLTRTIRSCKTD